jgi:MFS superfamily sulfate permease-like transporter
VVLATILSGVMRLPIQYVNIPENLLSNFNFPEWGNRELWLEPKLWGAILGFAVIASAETLLCATAVDRMHDGPRTQYDRELLAQGVGNMLCGVLGALPITGVIVRSSANLEAGAKTRYSAVMHGAWILLFVALLPFVIRLVPTASLAAILVYTGFKLVNPAAIRKLWEVGRGEVVIYASTLVAIVATDLLTGVLVGFGLALLRLLYTLTHLELIKQVSADGARIDVGLKGAATFIQLPKIAELLESLDERAEVHFHLGSLAYVDHAILEMITEWHQRRGGQVSLEMDELRARAGGRLVLPEIKTLPKAGASPGLSMSSA